MCAQAPTLNPLSDIYGKKIPLAREECRLVTGLRAEPKTRALM